MARFNDDWIAFPHAVGALDELMKALAEASLPEVCTSAVVPGEIVALDYIGDECDSFAWARVTTVYPSRVFPNPDERGVQGLGAVLTFAVGIELGIVRRMPIPDLSQPPSVEEHYETSRLQTADMRAMLQALCAHAGEDAVAVGTYQPLGPEGGVVGGAWTATFGAG